MSSFNYSLPNIDGHSGRLEAHLTGLKGKRVYFDPLRGNRGDELIVLGIRELLVRQEVTLCNSIDEADHVLIKGGGAFLDTYESLLNYISELFESCQNKPVTLMPTSFGLSRRSLEDIVGPRDLPVQVFVRERASLEILQARTKSPQFSYALEHDTAFYLLGSKFLSQQIRKRSPKHILVVERQDAESLDTTNMGVQKTQQGHETAGSYLRVAASSMVPDSIKVTGRRLRNLKKIEDTNRQTPFAKLASDFLVSRHPEHSGTPVRFLDASDNTYSTFPQFVSIIRDASIVLTTRLHVGILSAMLGIPTYLVPGVYHKLSGIHSLSMNTWPHVTLLPRSFAAGQSP
ncbi:polysaccharide pyruvyl transferase family protein [Crateriforma conspicua]|uniref:Polysaccharide pyruvyl transferase n=1 Tax=Crateriforma conspicua TaxID=2527996 RepID=A0A5C5Y071_9PLAN|nr:polysaccharide pyruvyl transferase family protein [Crateriforma conspicua]TWT69067.1 Polysaccharide pyruvyl transferase [Crateriforma conspicua]